MESGLPETQQQLQETRISATPAIFVSYHCDYDADVTPNTYFVYLL